jgi:hypothetical protein
MPLGMPSRGSIGNPLAPRRPGSTGTGYCNGLNLPRVIDNKPKNNFIATPRPTPAAFGDPFEGGFYTGMIWNQRTQSATTQTIDIGIKTFTTTDDMATTPLFYSGQIVEVRQRTNPNARMRGTVTAAVGTTLTINVTTTNGGGAFNDWSIMCRFRLIVAPRSGGEASAGAYKSAAGSSPEDTATLSEGFRATEAMRLAGGHPAASFTRSLTIGGYTDWYLPARDELELAWRNLKPTSDNNYLAQNKPSGYQVNYWNLGSFGDSGGLSGNNNNSEPPAGVYTATVPGITSNPAFQAGGEEAFAYGSGNTIYWSSTEYDFVSAWFQFYSTSGPGWQAANGKTNAWRIRAFRRSVI